MDMNTQVYLISRLDNIIGYCNSIKEVIEKDKSVSNRYLFEKIDAINENLELIKELEE